MLVAIIETSGTNGMLPEPQEQMDCGKRFQTFVTNGI